VTVPTGLGSTISGTALAVVATNLGVVGFFGLLTWGKALGLTALGYGLQWLFVDREANLPFVKRYTVVAGVCSLATLLNPYGYKLHMHIAGYLQSSFVLDTVEEFQSPRFRGENMLQFEILLFAGMAVAGILFSKKRFVEALLILFWAQQSLTSVRHAPIFVIVAAPILVEELTEEWNRWSRGKSRQSLAGILRDLGAEFSGATLRPTIWAPVMLFGLTLSMANGSTDMWPTDFPKTTFPIAMIDQYSARLVPVTTPMSRIFTSDQWADYLTYRFYPRTKIFVDGRSDLFGPVLGKEYVQVASGHHQWEEILNKYRIDTALVPVEWPLAELLKRSPAWRLIKDDKRAILFERRTPVLTPVLMKTESSAEVSSSTRRNLLP